MSEKDWSQIKEIFAAASELSGAAREIFLNEQCGADENLRRRVRELLRSHDEAAEFLDKPAIAEVAEEILENAPQFLQKGQIFGRYEILDKIGAGGMGEVYLAHDSELGRETALKVLPRNFAGDAERMRRFVQEARAASALNHPNIVTIYEIGTFETTRFIAAEYVAGETLRELIAGEKKLTLREIVEIALQIAAALEAAHAAGIVHRDVKPENIMIRRDRIVKILDFGLAKLAPNAEKLQNFAAAQVETEDGLILGTVAYMSPEQMRGQAADARSDIWSFGVCLYEMLAGRTPFAGETESDRFAATLTRDVPPVSDFVEIPPALEKLIAKTLVKNRAERYESAVELRLDLTALLGEQQFAGGSFPLLKPRAATETEFKYAATAETKTHVTAARQTPKSNLKTIVLSLAGLIAISASSFGAYFAYVNRATTMPEQIVSAKPKNPRGTDSDEAYQLYLTAAAAYRKSTINEARDALDKLERAVALDPNYAAAYAQIADIYLFLTGNSVIPAREGSMKIRAAAMRAVQIDPTLSRAYVALAAADITDYEWQNALENFQRAEQLAPDDASLYARYAETLSLSGRPDAALEKIRRGIALNPLRPNVEAAEGAFLYNARHFKEAEAKLQNVLQLQPDNPFPRAYLAYVQAVQGRFDEAIENYKTVLKADANNTTSPYLQVANLYARAGKKREAREYIKKAEATKKFISPGELAMVYGNLGELDKAFELFNKAYETRDYYLQYIYVDANFDALRDDRRFTELLKKANFVQ